MVEIGEKGFSRTRRTDPQRLERVKNAKLRTLGVDKEALQKQVEEKKAIAAQETAVDRFHSEMDDYFHKALTVMEQERLETAKALKYECQDFRNKYQGRATSRDYDLSEKLRDGKPARTSDDDENCGVASMQKFEGEDLVAADRINVQKIQQRKWADSQVEVKVGNKKEQILEDLKWGKIAEQQADYANAVAALEDTQRTHLALDTSAANKELAMRKQERELDEKVRIAEGDEKEKDFIQTSPFFTEDPSKAISSLASHRKRVTEYKGMSDSELESIFATQALQREEMAERRALQKESELAEEMIRAQMYTALEIKAQDALEYQQEQRMMLTKELNKQREEKVGRDSTLKSMYKNVPTPEFFTQFGTSHR